MFKGKCIFNDKTNLPYVYKPTEDDKKQYPDRIIDGKMQERFVELDPNGLIKNERSMLNQYMKVKGSTLIIATVLIISVCYVWNIFNKRIFAFSTGKTGQIYSDDFYLTGMFMKWRTVPGLN